MQTNQQNTKEQKPEIHHLSTLPTRDNFVHCNHNLLSSKTMVAMNPPLGNSKPPNFGKPYGLFTSLSSSVLYWIQTYLCL